LWSQLRRRTDDENHTYRPISRDDDAGGAVDGALRNRSKEDQPEALMQAVQQRQLVEGSDQVAETRTLFVAPAQPAGLSGRYAMISLVSEAYGSVRVLETLQAIDFQNVSPLTVPEERPKWWCLLIFCKRGW